MRDNIVKIKYKWLNSVESNTPVDEVNNLIKLVIKYKEESTNNTFDKIVLKLNGLLLVYLKKVESYYREDLNQELLIGIYKTLRMFKINTNILNKDDLVKDDSNPYVINFNEKYGLELSIKHLSENDLEYYLNELILFCNQNQFLKYVDKTLNNICIDFFRKHKKEINKLIIKVDETEFVDRKTINPHSNIFLESDYKFDKEDLDFLKQFIEDDRILTEKEVGEKLGISQQAVNKRKKAIKQKYINSRL